MLTGEFRLPLESLGEAREAMARVINASRAEPGCIAYSYGEDVLEPGLFRVSEVWTSEEALQAHFREPHMDRWREERERLGMFDKRMTNHAVSKSTQF